MIDLLRLAAAERGERDAVITTRGRTTFAQLLERSEWAAANLQAAGIDRFAILDDDPAHVFALLAGASLAGVEPCVYPIAATDEAVTDYRDQFDHEHIVTSRETLLHAGATASASILGESDAAVPVEASIDRGLLVMTTGTTGAPKAARHEWRRVLRPTERIRPVDDQCWLLAYGLNQFGGLQILIHVAAARTTLVAADTFQPRDGLAAMRRWGVTHASGTPTFWRFLLMEMQGDDGEIPALQQITISGEAVPPSLLERLDEQFPAARVSQIYGANEFGQTVTVGDGIAGLPTSVLDEGGDVVFKVVDDELWIRSTACMLGYYGQEPIDPDAWRATGDLVEIVGDRIEFRGRSSDVINVGGVKVHPLPIEDRISRVAGVELVHVFGRPNPMVGAIVAVQVVATTGQDQDELDAEIRRVCADLPPASRPRNIRFVETMSTTGNKLSRHASA